MQIDRTEGEPPPKTAFAAQGGQFVHAVLRAGNIHLDLKAVHGGEDGSVKLRSVVHKVKSEKVK